MTKVGWVIGANLFVLNAGLSVLDFLARDPFFIARIIAMCCVGYILIHRVDVWRK